MITLANAHISAQILPELGGGMARLDAHTSSRPSPILRPWSGQAADPVDRAMFVMLPWCNRISQGGIAVDGTRFPLSPTVPGQDMPIHGRALLQNWIPIDVGHAHLALRLRDSGTPPFDYEAELRYRLVGRSLTVSVRICHMGAAPVPYGMGFHPWFAHRTGDRLGFKAQHFVVEGPDRLPTHLLSADDADTPDFRTGAELPEALLNATFANWNGIARLTSIDGRAVELRSRGATRHLHVFSRRRTGDFVCLEPVSHTVDSENRPMLEGGGMTVLSQGSCTIAAVQITLLPSES